MCASYVSLMWTSAVVASRVGAPGCGAQGEIAGGRCTSRGIAGAYPPLSLRGLLQSACGPSARRAGLAALSQAASHARHVSFRACLVGLWCKEGGRRLTDGRESGRLVGSPVSRPITSPIGGDICRPAALLAGMSIGRSASHTTDGLSGCSVDVLVVGSVSPASQSAACPAGVSCSSFHRPCARAFLAMCLYASVNSWRKFPPCKLMKADETLAIHRTGVCVCVCVR